MMSRETKVLVYGASGYTGKLVAECLAQRDLPFIAAGRNADKLAKGMEIVKQRHGASFDFEIATPEHSIEALAALFESVEVVINTVGPFMQLGWEVVEACLQSNCHYMDTTGEQDWVKAIADKYGQAFEDKGLLLAPANAYMWSAGALAAEVVLETEGVDSLDIAYQIDNGIPSEASSMSFMRMVTKPEGQLYLEQGEYKSWPWDQCYSITFPHRVRPYLALPWGGAGEPIWFKNDDRVRNCSVLTAFGDPAITGVMQLIEVFKEKSKGKTIDECEEITNQMGMDISTGEPEKDRLDVQRSVIVCHGQGRQVTKTFVMNLSAPYQWTGQVTAESAERILNGQLKQAGFRSAPQAFGHRELLERFHELGYCSLPE
jgi:hypothetical protein